MAKNHKQIVFSAARGTFRARPPKRTGIRKMPPSKRVEKKRKESKLKTETVERFRVKLPQRALNLKGEAQSIKTESESKLKFGLYCVGFFASERNARAHLSYKH